MRGSCAYVVPLCLEPQPFVGGADAGAAGSGYRAPAQQAVWR